jgi:putative phosphoesterase
MRLGLISDTHGLLRPEALAALQGSGRIVHAGDIGNAGILEQLARIAPVTAVRGNNDHGPWAEALPETAWLQLEGVAVCIVHDLKTLQLDRPADVVIAGHSHKPLVERREGTLFVNPGSAGPRRFSLPVSVGELLLEGGSITPRLVTLDIAPRRPIMRPR